MSEEESADLGINRRRFMRKAGTAAVGVAAIAVGADAYSIGSAGAAQGEVPLSALDPKALVSPASVPTDNVLEGQIVSIEGSSLLLDPTDSAPIRVELTPDVNVTREGPVPLSAYQPGDEVILLGARQGDGFKAVAIAAVFRFKLATVYSRQGQTLDTSEGRIVLTPRTTPRAGLFQESHLQARPLSELGAGDEIGVSGLVNQKSQVMTATQIGVLSAPGDPLFPSS